MTSIMRCTLFSISIWVVVTQSNVETTTWAWTCISKGCCWGRKMLLRVWSRESVSLDRVVVEITLLSLLLCIFFIFESICILCLNKQPALYVSIFYFSSGPLRHIIPSKNSEKNSEKEWEKRMRCLAKHLMHMLLELLIPLFILFHLNHLHMTVTTRRWNISDETSIIELDTIIDHQ